MTKPAKLSPAMQHVLDRMDEGWNLTMGTSSLSTGARMTYKPVIGKMGWESVRVGTVIALEDRGLIRRTYGYPEATFTRIRAASGGPGGDHD